MGVGVGLVCSGFYVGLLAVGLLDLGLCRAASLLFGPLGARFGLFDPSK